MERRTVTKTEQYYLNEKACEYMKKFEDYNKVQNELLRLAFNMFLGENINYDEVYVCISKAMIIAYAEKEVGDEQKEND